jgi:hypothetical protein
MMDLKYCLKDEAYKAARGYENIAEINRSFGNRHIGLIAARNQNAAFQILLFCSESYILSIDGTPYYDNGGIMKNVRLSAEIQDATGTLSVEMKMIEFVDDCDGLDKADIISNIGSINIKAGLLQPVWTEIIVPGDAKAGSYQGRISVFYHKGFEKEIKTGEMTFDLAVKNVVLPDPSQFIFYLDIWQHNSNIARKHEVPLWSDKHFEIMENYIISLAELGQKAITAIVSEIPWSGQFCFRDSSYPSNLFEYSMIKITRASGGNFVYDYSVLDRYIDLCFMHHIDKEIEVFGLINIWIDTEYGFGKISEKMIDGIRIRYLDEAGDVYSYMDDMEDIKDYIKHLEKYFIEKKVIDKVRIMADEPAESGTYKKRLDFLKENAPLFKYKAALNHSGSVSGTKDIIDDFVPYFDIAVSENEMINDLKQNIKGRLCWYICCMPEYPNTFIGSDLTECYSIGWLTEYMRLDGFLRWAYTAWPEEPRRKLTYRPYMWKTGDGNFVYPNANGRPLLSLRYKALQRGIQHFELLQLLKQKCGNHEKIINEAFGSIFRFKDINEFSSLRHNSTGSLMSTDHSDYRKAAEIILDALEDE